MTRHSVLLCADGTPMFDLGSFGLDVDVRVLPGLCQNVRSIRDEAAGADTLVVGLCDDKVPLGALQREARRADLDALALERVDLRTAADDGARLAVLIAGALARARAFPGSDPEQAKMSFPERASRRALLTFSLPEYQPGPKVNPARCFAETGCRVCADTCPERALRIDGGRVLHDKVACEPCGRCTTACPAGAISIPTATAPQIDALIRAVLDHRHGPPRPRGIVYACRRATRIETAHHWYPVVVPCTSMVTPAWLLTPLLLGAGAVAVRPCSVNGCSLGRNDVVEERVGYARALLAEFGITPRRVDTVTAGSPPPPMGTASLEDPFGPTGMAEVTLALSQATGVDAALERPDSPLGVVEIDPRVCTGCMACADVCPSGALAHSVEGSRSLLRFDARSCVACGQCLGRCVESPRGAIKLRKSVDVTSLRQGSVVVFDGVMPACESCGTPIAPTAMLRRVGEMLDNPELLRLISTRCSNCRGLAGNPQPSPS